MSLGDVSAFPMDMDGTARDSAIAPRRRVLRAGSPRWTRCSAMALFFSLCRRYFWFQCMGCPCAGISTTTSSGCSLRRTETITSTQLMPEACCVPGAWSAASLGSDLHRAIMSTCASLATSRVCGAAGRVFTPRVS